MDSLKRTLQMQFGNEITFQCHTDQRKGQIVFSSTADLQTVAAKWVELLSHDDDAHSSDTDMSVDMSLQLSMNASICSTRDIYYTAKSIKDSIETTQPLIVKWPPSTNELTLAASKAHVPPELFNLIALLTGATEDVPKSDEYVTVAISKEQKILSICQDIVYLVGNGKYQTPKSLALGLTLRHYTGSSSVSRLISKLGHCSSYDTIVRLETALAKAHFDELQSLGLPQGFEQKKWTTLVYDNIDFSEETVTGAGTTHFTNGIMVQSNPAQSHSERRDASISRRLRTLADDCCIDINQYNFSKSQRLGPTDEYSTSTDLPISNEAFSIDLAYCMLKLAHQSPETFPNWTQFNQSLACYAKLPTSILYYLPIIEASPTEYGTINTILTKSVAMADKLQLRKIVVVFDLAIYAKIQELRWKTPLYQERTIVRLGEFHTAMSYLGILGKRFGEAGLSEILIESGVVSGGSLNGVLNGHHYNRSVRSHKVTYEALERMRLQQFMDSLSEEQRTAYMQAFDDLMTTYKDEQFEITLNTTEVFLSFACAYKDHIRQYCAKNATYKFWSSYIDMVELLLEFLRATRTSDWEGHLQAVRKMLPWYFAYDKKNYLKYLSLYYMEMKELESADPESYQQISTPGNWTVTRTDRSFTSTAMDQTIEQTINRQCKTSGGIQGVTLNPGSIQRWIMAQPTRAAVSDLCEQMAGMSTTEHNIDICKSDAIQNEKFVSGVVTAVAGMTNPFDNDLTPSDLISISSGVIASDCVKDDMLSAKDKGEAAATKFLQERLVKKEVDFFSPWPMMKLKNISSATRPQTKSSKLTQVKQDRALFSRLLIVSQNRQVDLKEILTYPLSQFPLSLSTLDGSLSKTNKAVLLHELESICDKPLVKIDDLANTALIIDSMVLIQGLPRGALPSTFGELATTVMRRVTGLAETFKASRIDFVCDQYLPESIKNIERQRRGALNSQRVKVSFAEQKLPKQWQKFLANGENKKEMLEFIVSQWKNMQTQYEFYVTLGACCYRLSQENQPVMECQELYCTHEEADTRLGVHAVHASKTHEHVVVWSVDTDVAIILLSVIDMYPAEVELCLATGAGKTKRIISISAMGRKLGIEASRSLVYLHALTGCDTVSCFFGRGKKKLYKR